MKRGSPHKRINDFLGHLDATLPAPALQEPEQHSQSERQFDPGDLVIEFTRCPYILLNFENHIYSFSVDISVKNYGASDIRIVSGECRTIISSYGFIDLEKTKPVSLEPRRSGEYSFQKSLTDGEVRRALYFFRDATERGMDVQLTFLLTGQFGESQIHSPSKATCAVMCKIGQQFVQDENNLIIKYALYGTPSNAQDVTDSLRARVVANKLELRVDNDLLGQDPAIGRRKTLAVIYSYNGELLTKSAREDEVLSLPL
jgi:hypothetical protein